MTTVQVPVSLGGTNTPYNDGTGAYGMASNGGHGYETYLFPLFAEMLAACGYTVTQAQAVIAAIAANSFLLRSNNLSDLATPATALTNLGLSADGKSLVTAADYAAMRVLLGVLQASSNLSDLASASSARLNLGLGPMATMGGSYTFAQMKALNGMADGDLVRVSNYGRGGSTWRYSAADADWFPTAPTAVYESRTLISGLVQTANQVLLAIPVEANLLKNKVWRLLFSPAKNGSTDTLTPSLRFGTAGTVSDTLVSSSYSTLTGAVRVAGKDTWQYSATSTQFQRLGGQIDAAWSGAGFTLGAFQAITGLDLTVANFLDICASMSGTTDTPQLAYTRLEIMP